MYTAARDGFIQDNEEQYTHLGLTNEFNTVVQAYNDVINLPAWGYHLTASQAYANLRTTKENARTALQAAEAAAPPTAQERAFSAIFRAAFHAARNDSSPNTPGAHHIRHVAGDAVADNTRADDIAQDADALVGRRGRIPEPPVAIPVAEEIDEETETSKSDIELESNEPPAEENSLDPELSDIHELPVAEASHVNPVDPSQSSPPVVNVLPEGH